MTIIDYTGTGVYTLTEISDDEPLPKGIMVCPLDLIVTRAFVDQWSGHFEREDRVRADEEEDQSFIG